MLKVLYELTVNDEVGGEPDYSSPNIAVEFNCSGARISFCPETLGESKEWSNLITAIKNGTKYSICSEGTNSNYTIGYDNSKLNLSIGAFGSGTVGELSVVLLMTSDIEQTLIELEKLAMAIENCEAYKQ
jgi:hypothetical protein